MTVMAPERTVEQRLEALAKANETRVARAAVKRRLKTGDIDVADVLAEPIEWSLATMKLFDLLCAVPKMGRVKAARLMNSCRVSQSKTVGGVSTRQRSEILKAVAGRRP